MPHDWGAGGSRPAKSEQAGDLPHRQSAKPERLLQVVVDGDIRRRRYIQKPGASRAAAPPQGNQHGRTTTLKGLHSLREPLWNAFSVQFPTPMLQACAAALRHLANGYNASGVRLDRISLATAAAAYCISPSR